MIGRTFNARVVRPWYWKEIGVVSSSYQNILVRCWPIGLHYLPRLFARVLWRLSRAGFLTTAEAAEYRWSDFTPRFWKTLGERERELYRRLNQLAKEAAEARRMADDYRVAAASWYALEGEIAKRESEHRTA